MLLQKFLKCDLKVTLLSIYTPRYLKYKTACSLSPSMTTSGSARQLLDLLKNIHTVFDKFSCKQLCFSQFVIFNIEFVN